MMAAEQPPVAGLAPVGLAVARPRRQSTASWPLIDRIGYWLCWATGVALCAIALGIVLFMFIKGVSYLQPSLFVHSPSPSVRQSEAGGFFDPILGTFILTGLGIAIAAPAPIFRRSLASWQVGQTVWASALIDS